jgi:hypothetical protein
VTRRPRPAPLLLLALLLAPGLVGCEATTAPEPEPQEGPNQPPSPPIVVVTPELPKTLDPLVCSLREESLDPEGGRVDYRFAWDLNWEATDIVGDTVDPEHTLRQQIWTCRVVAIDGQGNESAEGSWGVAIQNTPPNPPRLRVYPDEPHIDEPIRAVIEQPAFDVDGDGITYFYYWFRDGVEDTSVRDTSMVEPYLTRLGEQWKVQVLVLDGHAISEPAAEDSADVTVEVVHGITSGGHHTCLLDVGVWSCWGSDSAGQVSGPTDAHRRLAVGLDDTCGLRLIDSELECWGEQTDAGVLVPPEGEYADVDLGETHGCLASSTGVLSAFGDVSDWDEPPTDGAFFDVVAGPDSCCAIDWYSDEVHCWGADPVEPPFGPLMSLDGGDGFYCATQMGNVLCWGPEADEVAQVPEGLFASVTVGPSHACGQLMGSGEVACWGADQFGQADPPGGAFRAIDAGKYHTCGVRLDSSVVCWGCQQPEHGDGGPSKDDGPAYDSGQCDPSGF